MSAPTVCSNSKRVGGLYPTSISISVEQSFVLSPGALPHPPPPPPFRVPTISDAVYCSSGGIPGVGADILDS